VVDHLEILYIAQELRVPLSHARTLRALNDIPVMDYRIVEMLDLYSRSKMRKNVLEPLRESEWIIMHSLLPAHSKVGAPRLAWTLNQNHRSRLSQVCREAKTWALKQKKLSTMVSMGLLEEIGVH